MTVLIDYKQASADFDRFMLDLRETLDLQTTHQAWGVLLGVFDAFRRRLQADQALDFAKALPSLLRAVFVQDWCLADPHPPLPTERRSMSKSWPITAIISSPSRDASPAPQRRCGGTSTGSRSVPLCHDCRPALANSGAALSNRPLSRVAGFLSAVIPAAAARAADMRAAV